MAFTAGHSGSTAINPLDGRGNYSATSNNMKLVHWPLISGLLYLVQRGDWVRQQSIQDPPCCTKLTEPTHQQPVYQSLYCCIIGE